MDYKHLTHINTPQDLKQLPVEALPELCAELRDFIIRSCAKNPGHLASSLGAIELTVALHYVLDTPHDRLLFDVGHQAYAHKILTERRERFATNRCLNGIAPFPTPLESEYDAFIAGHASNSISAALGMAVAQTHHSGAEQRRIVAVIGDGALTGGLAYEGLNNSSMLHSNLLIVLNDNNMAIDPIRGGITQYLVDITTSSRYNRLRYRLYQTMRAMGLMSDKSKATLQRFNNNIKSILSHQQRNIFSGLNLRYFGPADGHDVVALVKILQEIKDYAGPKVLHLITQKGKGYAPAEANQTLWHAPGKFDPETGERLVSRDAKQPLWQDVFGQTVLELAREDERVVAITPAMPSGSGLIPMKEEMPTRVFDCGIAEAHAVTFSAGMAHEGAVPYCAIYSSFLQRAYDSIIHDVAITGEHVIFGIDRAGIVGQDGATHHGLFDIASLRCIPHLRLLAPMDAAELKAMLRWAKDAEGPIAIRYPRGCTPEVDFTTSLTDLPAARCLQSGKQAAVLSFGAIGNHVSEAVEGLDVAHYDMRSIVPLDTKILDELSHTHSLIFTVEDGILQGGAGSAVTEYLTEHSYGGRIVRLGINQQFVAHGKPEELYAQLGLDAASIRNTITNTICA